MVEALQAYVQAVFPTPIRALDSRILVWQAAVPSMEFLATVIHNNYDVKKLISLGAMSTALAALKDHKGVVAVVPPTMRALRAIAETNEKYCKQVRVILFNQPGSLDVDVCTLLLYFSVLWQEFIFSFVCTCHPNCKLSQLSLSPGRGGQYRVNYVQLSHIQETT